MIFVKKNECTKQRARQYIEESEASCHNRKLSNENIIFTNTGLGRSPIANFYIFVTS